MKLRKRIYSILFFVPLLVGMVALLSSCSDDKDELQQTAYGYVQFKLYKSASMDKEADTLSGTTRAAVDKLETLSQAQKVKVVMLYNGSTIEQTLLLSAYNADNGEFGLTSDKLQLQGGDYTLIGFYLYDKLDQLLYAGPAASDNVFTVVPGGLHVQRLAVDAVKRGLVKFRLVKKLPSTRAGATYPFENIKCVTVRVKNVFTNEQTTFEKLAVKYTEDFKDNGTPGQNPQTSYGVCDSLVWLKGGTYTVSSYTTYSDKKGTKALETATVSDTETFVVTDNEETKEAPVPIRLSETAEYLKDYMALKEIWEALDGEHWSYFGEVNPKGCTWDFNKDIDMWGNQPGVGVNSDGRVTSLALSGFGINGVLPDAIGQLTELRTLYLGAHDELLGGNISNAGVEFTAERKMAVRMDYEKRFLARDPREALSQFLQDGINLDPKQKRIVKSNRIQPKDLTPGRLTNQLTGISKAIMRLSNLQQFFIANSPITTEEFLRDIQPDSPFYGEELSWANMEELTDLELYNCPKMKSLPMDMLSQLPALSMLNIACNPQIDGDELLKNWNEFIDGASGPTIQLIYMGYNSLKEFPPTSQLQKMVKLSSLDCVNNQVSVLHPFGKSINLVKCYLDNNQITEIPGLVDPTDGYAYFCGFAGGVEGLTFSHNKLTKVPNVFNAKSIYVMGSVDLSYNQIDGFEDGDDFRGINANTINLGYNRLTTFPAPLFKSGSPVTELVLAGNGMTNFPKGSMTGSKSQSLRTLDLTYNKLTKLPEDFYATNVPYLYGVDLSYNSFSSFPYAPLDAATLTVYGVRYQRDGNGNRTLREWPTGIYKCPSLVQFAIGGNDIRKVEDTISPYIRIFDIKDNPYISIDLSSVCAYIKAGSYKLIYDKTQDIRGCDALDLE